MTTYTTLKGLVVWDLHVQVQASAQPEGFRMGVKFIVIEKCSAPISGAKFASYLQKKR